MTDRRDPLKPYAGRWIARVGQRVVGQGGSPLQAKQAAQAARHKEIPEIVFVPANSSLKFPSILDKVVSVLPDDRSVYLVGGAVRDAIMQRPAYDLDFAVETSALQLARKVANALQGAFYNMDEEHETGRVILSDEAGQRIILDFATLRGGDIDADLIARDFTINAMAVDVRHPQELIDPLGGVADGINRLVKACSSETFTADPLRTLRMIRFAAKFGFTIEPQTRSAAKLQVHRLSEISPERKRDELFKILAVPKPAASLRALDILAILNAIFPELAALKQVFPPPPHTEDVWNHTLHVIQRLEYILSVLTPGYVHDNEFGGDLVTGLLGLKLGRFRHNIADHFAAHLTLDRDLIPLLFLGALFHDVGKQEDVGPNHAEYSGLAVVKRARALALSNAEIDRLSRLVQSHGAVRRLAKLDAPTSPRNIYRFYRETGTAGVEVVLFSLADLLAAYGPALPQEKLQQHVDVMRALLEAYFDQYDQVVSPPPLIDGNILMHELNLQAGPQIGLLLEAIREEQAAGEVATKQDAIAFARSQISRE